MQFNMVMIGLNIHMCVLMDIMKYGPIELNRDVGNHTEKHSTITNVTSRELNLLHII